MISLGIVNCALVWPCSTVPLYHSNLVGGGDMSVLQSNTRLTAPSTGYLTSVGRSTVKAVNEDGVNSKV